MPKGKTSSRDYTGIVSGKLTYIRPTEDRKREQVIWECKCECGVICYMRPLSQLSCGCRTTAIDVAGQKYNRLTLIAPTNERMDNKIIWECKCDCGKICYVSATQAKNNVVKSCGCLNSETAKVNGHINGKKCRKYTPIQSTAHSIWRDRYMDGCDFDTFYTTSQQDCFYCGRPPSNTYNVYRRSGYNSEEQRIHGTFTYNGLDRIDSKRDHSHDNIVPCCKTCNWMKGDMGVEDFLAHIARVHIHSSRSHQGTHNVPNSHILELVGVFDLI